MKPFLVLALACGAPCAQTGDAFLQVGDPDNSNLGTEAAR